MSFPKNDKFLRIGLNRLINIGVHSEPLVREFYVIIVLKDDYTEMKAWVKNHFVKYDAISVNSMLGSTFKLRKGKQSSYEEWLNKERSTQKEQQPMITEMEEVLCLPNRHFKCGVIVKKLHKVDMTGLAQFWTTFILDNIVPNSHKPNIPMKRAQLLYAIIKDLSINIGQILSYKIFTISRKKCSPLGLPCLITALYARRGIDITGDIVEPYVALKPNMDTRYILKTFSKIGDESLPVQPPPPPPKPLSLNERLEKILEEMNENLEANHRLNLLIFYHLRG